MRPREGCNRGVETGEERRREEKKENEKEREERREQPPMELFCRVSISGSRLALVPVLVPRCRLRQPHDTTSASTPGKKKLNIEPTDHPMDTNARGIYVYEEATREAEARGSADPGTGIGARGHGDRNAS